MDKLVSQMKSIELLGGLVPGMIAIFLGWYIAGEAGVSVREYLPNSDTISIGISISIAYAAGTFLSTASMYLLWLKSGFIQFRVRLEPEVQKYIGVQLDRQQMLSLVKQSYIMRELLAFEYSDSSSLVGLAAKARLLGALAMVFALSVPLLFIFAGYAQTLVSIGIAILLGVCAHGEWVYFREYLSARIILQPNSWSFLNVSGAFRGPSAIVGDASPHSVAFVDKY